VTLNCKKAVIKVLCVKTIGVCVTGDVHET
jgi:hypothetical protein